jgi:DNA-binding MarR family transcriptional regulator
MEPRKRCFRITIRKVEKPMQPDVFADFDWICRSMGFFDHSEGENTTSRLFREVFLASERGNPATSTQLAEKINLSRGATINHLNNLLRAGLIEKHGHQYLPRAKNMSSIVDEIEDDVERVFKNMRETALQLDRDLALVKPRKKEDKKGFKVEVK